MLVVALIRFMVIDANIAKEDHSTNSSLNKQQHDSVYVHVNQLPRIIEVIFIITGTSTYVLFIAKPIYKCSL